MSKKEKLLKRFLTKPKDFTYDELKTVLSYFGYMEFNKGKTSGSRVMFYNSETTHMISIRKLHPGNTVKRYVIEDTISSLKENGVI